MFKSLNIIFDFVIVVTIVVIIVDPTEAKNMMPKTKLQQTKSISEKVKKAITKVKKMLPKTIEDSGTGEAFEDIQETVKLYQNIRAMLKIKNSTKLAPEDKMELLDEMKICKPAKADRCYSKCMVKDGTSYLWCHTTSNLDSWETCGCILRDEFIRYFGMIRDKLINPEKVPPLTDAEVALISALTTVIFLAGALSIVMVIYIMKLKRTHQPHPLGQPGFFVQNPIYQPPNEGKAQ